MCERGEDNFSKFKGVEFGIFRRAEGEIYPSFVKGGGNRVSKKSKFLIYLAFVIPHYATKTHQSFRIFFGSGNRRQVRF